MAASLYASKGKLKTLVVAKEILDLPKENTLDFFSGTDLKKSFEDELKRNKKYLQLEKQEVVSLEKNIVSFAIEFKTGAMEYAKSVIIATGQNRQTKEGNTVFDLITLKDMQGKIKVDSGMKTNVPGIFAAGEATDVSSADSFTIAGQGATAAMSVINFLVPK